MRTRVVLPVLRLAENDLRGATVAVAPVLERSATSAMVPDREIRAFILEAIARGGLDEARLADRAIDRALGLAEPETMLLPFLWHPMPALLDRHGRQNGAHAVLAADVLGLFHERSRSTSLQCTPAHLRESLSESKLRALRQLPSVLSAPEIANEPYVSVNTVSTDTRHLYDKLGAHRRVEAVEAARGLGLLSASSRASWTSSRRIDRTRLGNGRQVNCPNGRSEITKLIQG